MVIYDYLFISQDCPYCHSSHDIIPWGKGWMCRECGYEWDLD